jgi:hypothetical protein
MPPRPFSPGTAEQVIAVVEAVASRHEPVKIDFVAEFTDLTEAQAQAALELSVDLGLTAKDSSKYLVKSPLAQFLNTPNQAQKAAILRVVLESYEPFTLFRQRLAATAHGTIAAQQTKTTLGLDAHREDIRDTLVNLGGYSQALVSEGGGRYHAQDKPSDHVLFILARGCADLAAAEGRIREQLGTDASESVSREEVILPIANALLRAKESDGRGAVVDAANGVESFLSAVGNRAGVAAVAAAPGLNAKLEQLRIANILPSKLIFMGKYLGHIRNAADHGVDPEVNAPWAIRDATGIEYVFVACSFIAAAVNHENHEPPQI